MPAKNKPTKKLKAEMKAKTKPGVKKAPGNTAFGGYGFGFPWLTKTTHLNSRMMPSSPTNPCLHSRMRSSMMCCRCSLIEVAAELSEDPVRLYLREIGLVKLLGFRQRVSACHDHRSGSFGWHASQTETAQRGFAGSLHLPFAHFRNCSPRGIALSKMLSASIMNCPTWRCSSLNPSRFTRAGNLILLPICERIWITAIGVLTIFGITLPDMPTRSFSACTCFRLNMQSGC